MDCAKSAECSQYQKGGQSKSKIVGDVIDYGLRRAIIRAISARLRKDVSRVDAWPRGKRRTSPNQKKGGEKKRRGSGLTTSSGPGKDGT